MDLIGMNKNETSLTTWDLSVWFCLAHRYFDGQQECYWHLHERGVIKSRGSTSYRM